MAITPPQIPGLTDWRPLARGGFATVWEARQETLDRLVAVKVDQRRLDSESERLRFLREAGAAGRMSAHPGIVTVHDANILPDNHPYIVMDLCPGGSLTRYLAPDARLDEEQIRGIGVRIADALAATHARGVLHRDVKPANILVDSYGNAGLADFGLAAIAGPETPPEEAFEVLTPAYTAPEILHRRPPSASGDVYSLAATMYALLSGRPPRWPAEGTPTLAEVLQLQQQPVRPLDDVDPGLMKLLMEALALEPTERPDAADFGGRLAVLPLGTTDQRATAAVVLDSPGEVEAVGATPLRARGTGTRPRRRGLVLALLALALVAVLVGALVVVNRTRSPVAAVPVAPTTAVSTSPAASTAPTTAPPRTSPPASPAVPAGYTNCAAELGGPAYCPTGQECWAGIIGVYDSPLRGTQQDCGRSHTLQTFAAGPLDYDVRQQSTLEADPAVQRLCTQAVLKRMLRPADRRSKPQIFALPPQASDGDQRFFRCIFGRSERTTPVDLRPPT